MSLHPDVLRSLSETERELLTNAGGQGMETGVVKVYKDDKEDIMPVAYFRRTVGIPMEGEVDANQVVFYDVATKEFKPVLSGVIGVPAELTQELADALNAYWVNLINLLIASKEEE